MGRRGRKVGERIKERDREERREEEGRRRTKEVSWRGGTGDGKSEGKE